MSTPITPAPRKWTAKVVGVSFTGNHPRNLEVLRAMVGSDPVPATLVRNPANEFDANAIEVHAAETMIGHVPAHVAARLARHLDAGVEYDAEMSVSTHPDFPDNPGAVINCVIKEA